MPELPEVETVCRGLAAMMVGRTITHLTLRRPNLRYPFPPLMVERLSLQRIDRIERRAKYIQIYLSEYVWLIHLGMSGRFQPLLHVLAPSTHDHVIIDLDDGQRLAYHDPRRFGFMDLCSLKELHFNPHLKKLGLEPFDAEVTPELLCQKFSRVNRPIKTALLDQTLVAGLGNIYVCESLWLSQISPHRLASSLSLNEWKVLLPNIREVLTRAINAGGSSLKDHRQVNGHLGYFQHQFSVYDGQGRACQREGCQGTITKDVISNRSTYYCPQCQR